MDLTKNVHSVLERITDEIGLVGGVFAIIRHGEVEQVITYGYEDREAQKAVSERTYFPIASCSKAFTTMLCAQAVDERLITWDEPIKNHLPEFDLPDSYAGAHVSMRDLASHRSGVPGHDFLRNKIYGDRKNLTERTKYLDLNGGFRATYQYNNHMFIVLGYLLERLYGQSWESLVESKIAKPLGIEGIRFRSPDPAVMAGLDRALPYISNGFTASPCGDANNAHSAPCGGIKLNIRELCKWIGAMSRPDELFAKTSLCSVEQRKQLVTGVISTGEDYFKLKNSNYALGWKNSVYNNHTVINHSGGLSGCLSQVGFLPELDCGYAMSFNTGNQPAHNICRAIALDYLTTGAPEPSYTHMIEHYKQRRDSVVAIAEAASAYKPMTADGFAHLLGEYDHPGYTTFEITQSPDGLCFTYGDFSAKLYSETDSSFVGFTGDYDDLVPETVKLTLADGGMTLNTSDTGVDIYFKKVIV